MRQPWPMYAPDHAAIATPVGLVMIEGSADRVERIRIAPVGVPRTSSAAAVRDAAAQLEAYFAGQLRDFDLALAPATTPRGAALRQTVIDVGFGATASYGELAVRISSSARALGQACARNPFPIVVPCHRVVQAGGRLGPYSAGEGPATKRWLLVHEGVRLL